MPAPSHPGFHYGAGGFRHVFCDTGGGACLAFFDVYGVGEKLHATTAQAEDKVITR